MASPLSILQHRSPVSWLIAPDSDRFWEWFDRALQELDSLPIVDRPPKILLCDRHPVRFLARFLAVCSREGWLFLGNPNWVKGDWQTVDERVQPDRHWQHDAPLTPWVGQSDPQPNIDRLPSQSALIMIPTGGSSGTIRFAMHTWETLAASVWGFQQYFGVQSIHSYCVLPLYHVSGLMQFMRSLLTEGLFVVQEFRSLKTDAFLTQQRHWNHPQLPQHGFISLVPTQLNVVLEQSILRKELAQFQTVLLGGAPAWPDLLERARSASIPLALTYGMTETASQVATLKPQDFLRGCTHQGQVLPHARIHIWEEQGCPVPSGQRGSLAIQARSLALGYYPDRLFSDQTLITDDLGYWDAEQGLHVVGRASQVIMTGGEKVYPSEVEAVIRSTHLVQDIVVMGQPDPYWGEAVTAVYVPQGVQTTHQDIEAKIHDRLCSYKRPKHWIAVNTIPRNEQGKVTLRFSFDNCSPVIP